MSTINLIFGRRRTIGSYFIRLFSWGKWSHVAVLNESGTGVYEAITAGVVETPLGEFTARHSRMALTVYPCPDLPAAYKFLRGEIGKKYDWAGSFSFLLRRNLQKPSRWFCSELTTEAVKRGGFVLFHETTRVSPEMLWLHGSRRNFG